MSSFLIKAEHIGLQINQRQILDDISLTIEQGKIITLVGLMVQVKQAWFGYCLVW